jgi:hypothetical protein
MVAQIQEEQEIPVGKRVTFRVLGPAQGDLATEALGAKAAIAIFLALEIIGLLLILGIPRLVKAWRSVDAGNGPADQAPQLEALPRVAAPHPDHEPTMVSAGNELAERAQLGMRRGGD